MQSSLFEMSVEVEGRKIKEYGFHGKTHVEGRKGKPFIIKFKNNSADRVHAVFSIDGISVVDGQQASPESRGYVVPAYSSAEIKGWRTSLGESHKFVFEKKTQSYTGKKKIGTLNCGIIGCLVYSEKQEQKYVYVNNYPVFVPQPYPVYPYPCTPINPVNPWYWHVTCGNGTSGVWSSCQNNSSDVQIFNCSLSPSIDQPEVKSCYNSVDYNLGTAFGEVQTDIVSAVAFENGPLIASMEIYYSDKNSMVKAGIKMDKVSELAVKECLKSEPRAFSNFCTPPD